MSTKILKVVDVARHLGVPVRTLYDMIKDGRFAVQPIPGTKPRRWNIEDIDAWRKPIATPDQPSLFEG